MCVLSPLVDQLYVDYFVTRAYSPRLEDLTVRVVSDKEDATIIDEIRRKDDSAMMKSVKVKHASYKIGNREAKES